MFVALCNTQIYPLAYYYEGGQVRHDMFIDIGHHLWQDARNVLVYHLNPEWEAQGH